MIDRVKMLVKQHPHTYRAAVGLQALWRGSVGILNRRRGAGDHVRSTVSLLKRSPFVAGRPMNITIEPTNMCNLQCPVCETGAGVLGRPEGHMTLEQFKTIIDKVAPHANTLMFYFMGEPFLNKNAYQMIRYAKDVGIPFVTTCTNGDAVNPDKLVECGLDEVRFQIGGMTQQTHQVYRIGSNLDRIFRNLRETIRIRNERRSRLRIVSGFILMKHNEHQIEEFKSVLSQMGVDEAEIIDPCVRTIEQGRQMLPTDQVHWFYDPVAFERGELKPKLVPNNECPWIYYSMAVHVNGDVVPCCRDPKGEQVMGNLLTESFADIWNGNRYMDFRRQLHRDQGKIGICSLCSGYGVSEIR